jgi:hypothetical protein
MKGIQELKRELFRKIPGRHDVYSIQHKNSYSHVSAPLDLKTYLNDDLTVGTYLLDPNNLAEVAIVDIDVNKEAYTKAHISTFSDILIKQTQQIAGVLDAAGIKYLTEFSGFKGYHLIISFDQPVQASLVRKKLHELEKSFERVDERLHWELFPKQDKVPKGGYGNLIKMPLQKHQVSGLYSHFVDKDFNEIVPNTIPTNSVNILEVVTVESTTETAEGTMEKVSFQGPIPHNIERMELRCGYIKDAIKTAHEDYHLKHEPRVFLGALYKHLGVKGEKRIHEILGECSDYNKVKSNIKLSELTGRPATCEKMCGRNKCDAVKATDYRSPIGFAFQVEAQEIYEKRGRYVVKRFTKDGTPNDRILTEWSIRPIKIVNLGDKDVLYCDIVSTQGNTYFDQRLENEAWHGKQKLLKALGHSDLTFHGSEADVQNLAQYITSRTLIKKSGINFIGLKGDTFVAEGVNISAEGISLSPEIEVYIKGKENLASKYDLTKTCTDQEYLKIARTIYSELSAINEPEVIYPLIGWNALAPVASIIRKITGAFPVGNVTGEAGSGKTATLEKIAELNGSKDAKIHDSRTTKFALMHQVSLNNGFPTILDEYKETTMTSVAVNNIKDTLRAVYRGEVMERGHADQTVSTYKLQAPIIISGEYKITETAIRERAIFAGFKKKTLMDAKYSDSFARLGKVDLGYFQPRYIQYLLGVDLEVYFDNAQTYFHGDTTYNKLPIRVRNNWQVLHVGLCVWKDYATKLGIPTAAIPFTKIFERQAEELGYNTQGYMLRDVDRLVEHMSIMAENNIITHGVEYAIIDDTVLIHPMSMLAALRKYSQSHNLDIFIMDESSFRTQLKDADYFLLFDKKKIDGKQKRWAFLNFKEMEKAGLEIEGFSPDVTRFVR